MTETLDEYTTKVYNKAGDFVVTAYNKTEAFAVGVGGDIAGKIQNFVGSTDSPDLTLQTCSPAEATLRNRIHFANLFFSFPTTGKSSAVNTLIGAIGGARMDDRLAFPAYLQTFSEAYAVNWGKEEQVYGRADPIPVYSNTKRDITMAFSIPCYDSDDSSENLKKINHLIKNLYPGYITTKGGADILNTPPLVRIKFANLLQNHMNPAQGLLGYIKSFSHDMGIKERGVLMESGVLSPGFLGPRVINFNISFTALHEGTVGWDSDKPNTFRGNEQFPYGVKSSFGQEATTTLAEGIGLGYEYVADKVFGDDE